MNVNMKRITNDVNETDNNSGIYKITNIINGKIYIGSAKNFKVRWSLHRWELESNKHNNKYLQNAWNKHGKFNFIFEVVEYIEDVTFLLEREQYWLNETNCIERNIGYNISPTAGSTLGYKFTNEQKLKISIANKGKKRSIEQRKERRELWTKVNHPMLGKKHTNEAKIKISKNRVGKYFGENNPRAVLDLEKVKLIKLIINKYKMSDSQIGKIFGVSGIAITKIRVGENWSYVKVEKDEELPVYLIELIEGLEYNSPLGNALLSVFQVKQIKLLLRDTDLSHKEIAKIFEVKRKMISNISSNISYKKVQINLDDKFDEMILKDMNNIKSMRTEKERLKRTTSIFSAKLNIEQVKQIKLLLRDTKLNYVEIADLFNISLSSISAIAKGMTWGFVTVEESDEISFEMKENARKKLLARTRKLSLCNVVNIKLLLRDTKLSQRDIGKIFGVGQGAISNIKLGYFWSNVEINKIQKLSQTQIDTLISNPNIEL